VRAVLDPNVVISGLISREGAPAQLLSSWRVGRFELVVSPLLIEELRRALGYPKLRRRLSAVDAETAILWLTGAATPAPDTTTDPPVRSSDPGDDYLIALAAEQRAALVSGDRHLLDLEQRIPVYSPRDFLELIEST
jgi:putative PIN family toxin of toxin-antitoxin system